MTNNQTPIATDAIAAELLRMKEGAVRATREHDVEYYDGYASDDCMAIMPYGTFGKAWLLDQLRQPQASFQALGIEDERVTVLSGDCGLVFYTAVYPGRKVAVSTLFLRRDNEWRAVLYQQTVLDA
jgi:hypothetical protein